MAGIKIAVVGGGLAGLAAAMKIAERIKHGVVVTIFCDSAAKYLSESFWNESLGEAEIWP